MLYFLGISGGTLGRQQPEPSTVGYKEVTEIANLLTLMWHQALPETNLFRMLYKQFLHMDISNTLLSFKVNEREKVF